MGNDDKQTTPVPTGETLGPTEMRDGLASIMGAISDLRTDMVDRFDRHEKRIIDLEDSAWGGPRPSASKMPRPLIQVASATQSNTEDIKAIRAHIESQSGSMGVGLDFLKWLIGSRDGRTAAAAIAAAVLSAYGVYQRHQPAPAALPQPPQVVYIAAPGVSSTTNPFDAGK